MHVLDPITSAAAVAAALCLAAAVVAAVARRTPVPAPAWFLAAGIVAGTSSGRVRDAVTYEHVAQLGAVALVLVLFDGGLSGGWARTRPVLGPILVLGVVGTLATTALLALTAHWLVGLGWGAAWLVAVAIAPTDPAAVFSVVGGSREVPARSSAVVEGESGANDPVGIALMLGAIAAVGGGASGWEVAGRFAQELGIGTAVGVASGLALRWLVRRLAVSSGPLMPVAVLGWAAGTFAAASAVHGSGFLAAFIAGIVVGDAVHSDRPIATVAGVAAALGEVAVFAALGVTASRADIGEHLLVGVVLFVVLTFVVRPLVVGVLLYRSSLDRHERLFVAWAGLKGAVPVLLAALAVIADVRDASTVYAVVFVAVAASLLVQGTTIPLVVDRLFGASSSGEPDAGGGRTTTDA